MNLLAKIPWPLVLPYLVYAFCLGSAVVSFLLEASFTEFAVLALLGTVMWRVEYAIWLMKNY